MSFTVRNHYVPQWYQRRFLPAGCGASKLWYLDLKPETIRRPNGTPVRRQDGSVVTRDALRHLGPINCFQREHLYTLYFGKHATDVIEKRFFGSMDSRGETAVEFFSNYGMRDGVHEAFEAMRDYLAAQYFRTPKGLAALQLLSRSKSHQRTLAVLGQLWPLYHTIWMEGVWEIINCANSSTKFIISDAPVTTYNRMVFPGSPEALKGGGAQIERMGTHTLFPLDLNHCLVITNLQYVRNPKVNPMKVRENPRYFEEAMFDLRKVQRGREVEEEHVLAINHVLKTQSSRYVAAFEKDWLFPEKKMTQKFWAKLGGPHFLMPDPRKVSFTTGTLVGFEGGGGWGVNEYGHQDVDGARARELREVEWRTFQAAKAAWDERDRRAGRNPPSPEDLRDYW